MRSMLTKIKAFLRVMSPVLFYIIKYKRAANQIRAISSDVQYKKIFQNFC